MAENAELTEEDDCSKNAENVRQAMQHMILNDFKKCRH
jgi:hypothetical protein